MEKGYKNLVFFFILILVLVPFGFRRYFGLYPDFENTSTLLHFHVVVMATWCVILIAQPILIQKRKLLLHRRIGQFSYFLVPFIVFSMAGVMLHSFKIMKADLTPSENLANLFFPSTQILLFSVFYVLAMINRHKPPVHMRYIIISSVTLHGPTIGRLNFSAVGLDGFNWDLIIMDSVLIGLLVLDWRNRKNLKFYLIGLIAFLLVHVLVNFDFGTTAMWQTMASSLVNS